MYSFDILHDSLGGYKAIKAGFSWPAMFASFIWAMVKGMWGLAFFFFIVLLLLRILALMVQLEGMETAKAFVDLLTIAFLVYVGSRANEWYKNNLIREGCKYVTRCEAVSLRAAIRQLIVERQEAG